MNCCELSTQATCQTVIPPGNCSAGLTHAEAWAMSNPLAD